MVENVSNICPEKIYAQRKISEKFVKSAHFVNLPIGFIVRMVLNQPITITMSRFEDQIIRLLLRVFPVAYVVLFESGM
jgi:hypothetical protein